MGLDQYAAAIKSHPDNTDFTFGWTPEEMPTKTLPLMQWRKHPNLEGWMAKLYDRKADAQGWRGVWSHDDEMGNIVLNLSAPDGGEIPEDLREQLEQAQASLSSKMQELRQSVPNHRVFNNQMLRLSLTDLEQLEEAIKRDELPFTEGFFFGDPCDEEAKEPTLAFIRRARRAIEMGYDVYYQSDW